MYKRLRQPFSVAVAVLAVTALIYACVKEPRSTTPEYTGPHGSGRLTVEEARMVFEEQFHERCVECVTRSAEQQNRNIYVPRDYSPEWEGAVLTHNQSSSFMTVPLAMDKYLAIVDPSEGWDRLRKVAPVTQELYLAKNFEMELTIPSIKTTIPLDGQTMPRNMGVRGVERYVATRSMLQIFQSLDGLTLGMHLIEDGQTSVHLWIGEEPEDYARKLDKVRQSLEGLTLIQTSSPVKPSFLSSCGNKYCCTFCTRMVDYGHYCNPIPPVEVRSCPYCYAQDIDDNHRCLREQCVFCYQYYDYGTSHTCPSFWCPVCLDMVTGSQYNHSCPVNRCPVCNESYTGSNFNHLCPGAFCIQCGTRPCSSVCAVCFRPHCDLNHGGGGTPGPDPCNSPRCQDCGGVIPVRRTSADGVVVYRSSCDECTCNDNEWKKYEKVLDSKVEFGGNNRQSAKLREMYEKLQDTPSGQALKQLVGWALGENSSLDIYIDFSLSQRPKMDYRDLFHGSQINPDGTFKIIMNDYSQLLFAEEMGHVAQFMFYRSVDGDFSYLNDYPGNFELEAKMIALYHQGQLGMEPPKMANKSWLAIKDFMDDPTETNFNKAYQLMRLQQGYSDLPADGANFHTFRDDMLQAIKELTEKN